MSQFTFTEELEAFAERLEKDGYPTVLIERAAKRMKSMEHEIVRLNKLIEHKDYFLKEIL